MEKTAIELLVSAGIVITVDAERRVIADGAVAIDDGAIVEVGERRLLEDRFDPVQRIAMPNGVALPGLIDAHSHAGHGLIRTMGDDLDLWMETCERIYLHGATPEFWAAEARLSAAERIRSGTTTAMAMFGGAGDTIRCDDASNPSGYLNATAEAGIRTVLAIGPGAPPFPKPTTRHDGGNATRIESTFEDQMAVVAETVARHGDHPLHTIALTFPTLDIDDLDDGVHQAADAVAEFCQQGELLCIQDGHRGDTVFASYRLGLLGPRSVLSHAIDLTDDHIEVIASSGASIAHNPSAIFSQFGRCPVPELIAAGVTVGLGSDATAPDRSADMFRHMFQLTRYHRADRRDPSLFPPSDALAMATIGAATALGIDDQVGSLEPGKRADVIIVDAEAPHLVPMTHPVRQLVYFATGADVDTVIADGKVLMSDRQLHALDLPTVLDAARAEQERAFAR